MSQATSSRKSALRSRTQDMLVLAKERGLLAGVKSQVVRGRMPARLVDEAKRRSGISSDTQLIEVALANLAVSDDYGKWLLDHSGKIDPSLDLEF